MCKYFLYSCNYLWVTQCHVCILLKERILFSCVSSTFFFFLFKLVMCLYFPHLLNFSLKLFFPTLILCFLFLQGEKSFFSNPCCYQGELLLFIGGVVSISYRVELFCVPLILYFLLSFITYVYYLFELSLSIHDKRGRNI